MPTRRVALLALLSPALAQAAQETHQLGLDTYRLSFAFKYLELKIDGRLVTFTAKELADTLGAK